MKMLRNILTCLLCLAAVSAHADNDRPIRIDQLPQPAQLFIARYFGDSKVALAKMETDFMKKSYDVIFTDGSQVEFDSKGEWKEVSCKLSSVPADIIPAPIAEYVAGNYPDAAIVKIEKDHREYEVKLSNRIELTFDRKFNIIDIDY